jgi:hypothetical protein
MIYGLAGSLLLGGCPEVACDLMAYSSVSLTLVSEDGDAISDADVTFTNEDAGRFDEGCESLPDGMYVCGFEVAGLMEITIDAEGFEPVTELVDVQAGVCHVETESITVTLEALSCTAEVVTSVLLSVQDEAGDSIGGVTASWATDTLDDAECTPNGSRFACGQEVAGVIRLRASAPGYETGEIEVTVEEDFCHVITVEQTLVLEPTSDE